jgi:hypothetical protein
MVARMNNFDDEYRARATPTLEEFHLLLDGRRNIQLVAASVFSGAPSFFAPTIKLSGAGALSVDAFVISANADSTSLST